MTVLERFSTTPLPVRLNVGDFMLLDSSGALDAYRKTELIRGVIVAVNAQHRPHARVKDILARRIAAALEAQGALFEAITEVSVAMPPENMPEPDIVVTSEPRGEGPVPLASVALIVEVADTTLEFDLTHKAAVYAAAGVPEYWVADVNARVIHQTWAPEGEAYAERRDVAFGAMIAAATIEGLTVETGGMA